jgi:glutamate-ammonia-ligase adenylyltransferase
LLQMLRPFVYRKYLDFGVFESLREMKAMIDREATRRDMEDTIKLGPGGIRDIEFIGQTYQLIRGGREPALRAQGILQVLGLLARAGHLPERSCAELADSYRFLRRLENRLQIHADAQTHRLPEDESGRLRLAWTMGYGDPAAFERDLDAHRGRVRDHFERVFGGEQRGGAAAGENRGADYDALWTQGAKTEEGPATAAFGEEGLRRLALLRESYLYRSLSSKGRARMDRLMPLVLETVAGAENPPVTLLRVLELIELIARRTAYLALLAENPAVLNQMVRLCAASPWIARMIGAQPLLLDELIDTRALHQPLERAALERELTERLSAIDDDDLEQQMEALRQFKQANVLRVAAADVGDAMPLMIVSDHLTDIAEVCLAEVLGLAAAQTLRRNREAQRALERGFAIVAYGKLAGIELGYGSDLDIVFLHGDTDAGEIAQLFPRLGQRVIHMLSAHTPAGILYPVDLRLRPSGASGLLVSSISSFEEYQRSQAWTWEHQALVRARVVAAIGDDTVLERFTAVRGEVLGRERDPEALRGEIRDMRERMRGELSRSSHGRFDIKQDRGGIADIEFIVQYAVLRWAHVHPALLYWTDNIRLLQTLEDTGLLDSDTVRTMIDCYRGYRSRVHRLALQEVREAVVPEQDFAAERAAVSALWDRLIGAADSPAAVK